jgi:hypothetical protein
MTTWRLAGRKSTGNVAVMAVCLALAFAETAQGQDQVSDSVAKTPDWARRDSIKAESARPRWTSCGRLPRDFPDGTGPIGVFASCDMVNDMLRINLPRQGNAGTVIGISHWRGFVERDAETNRAGITFTLPATEATEPGAALTLRCRAGQLDVYVDSPRPIEYADNVTVRFGTKRPEDQEWLPGFDGTTLRLSGDGAAVKAFVRKVAKYASLAVQVQPHHAAPRSFTFYLGGIEVVSDQLLAACK